MMMMKLKFYMAIVSDGTNAKLAFTQATTKIQANKNFADTYKQVVFKAQQVKSAADIEMVRSMIGHRIICEDVVSRGVIE